jgi:hypothetical protein
VKKELSIQHNWIDVFCHETTQGVSPYVNIRGETVEIKENRKKQTMDLKVFHLKCPCACVNIVVNECSVKFSRHVSKMIGIIHIDQSNWIENFFVMIELRTIMWINAN